MKRIALVLAILLLPALITGCSAPDAPAAGTPAVCTWTVCACGDNGEPVAGVIVNFCTDTACTPVTTTDQGTAVFTGEPGAYHVQIVRVPEGWVLDGDAEWVTEPNDQTFRIQLKEAET